MLALVRLAAIDRPTDSPIRIHVILTAVHPSSLFAVMFQDTAAPFFRGVSFHSQQLIADVVASNSLYHSGSLPPDLQLPGLPEPNIEWLPHVPLIDSSPHSHFTSAAKPVPTSLLAPRPLSPSPPPPPPPPASSNRPILLQLAKLREPIGHAFDRVPPPIQAWLPWDTQTLVYCCGARLASLNVQSRHQQLYWGHTSTIAAVCAAQVHLQVPQTEGGGSVGSWQNMILTADEDDGGRILIWRWPLTLPDSQVGHQDQHPDSEDGRHGCSSQIEREREFDACICADRVFSRGLSLL